MYLPVIKNIVPFPITYVCYVIIQPPLSPLYGFFSSGTPLIRGSFGSCSSTKAIISAQFAATWGSEGRQEQTHGLKCGYLFPLIDIFNTMQDFGQIKVKLLWSTLDGNKTNPVLTADVILLTGVLAVLTSLFSWSSSIFKISLSDISRAILSVR